ncbi:unnamed protein product, partial [Ectocarpus sp. 8 AP-2014]
RRLVPSARRQDAHGRSPQSCDRSYRRAGRQDETRNRERDSNANHRCRPEGAHLGLLQQHQGCSRRYLRADFGGSPREGVQPDAKCGSSNERTLLTCFLCSLKRWPQ